MTPAFKSKRQQKIWERERKEAEAKKKTAASYVNQSPFRYAERNFKSRVPPPDFSQVVDFEKIEDHSDIIVPVQLTEDLRRLSSVFGRCETPCRDAFVLKNVPGLIIIPNAFTPVAQRSLIKQCMSVYPRPPNTSNLDTHYVIPETGLWPLYEAQENEALKPTDPGYFVPKKVIASDAHTDTSSDEDDADIEEAKEEPKMAPTACSDDFKPVTDNPKPDPLPAPGVPLLSPAELVRKMRWITLGYQYHWPTKTYHFDRRYPFPADVSELTKAVVTAVENIGYDDGNGNAWMNQYKGQNFNAEAGVINYYQYRDTLMGHVDRSEVNMEAPLVSLSLGQSCIYLIGGLTRETEPTPILLQSGDIVVMTGPCRRAFHGVPLIIEDTLPEYLSNKNQYDDAPDWRLFGDYMSTSRINLNIRQVYPKNENV